MDCLFYHSDIVFEAVKVFIHHANRRSMMLMVCEAVFITAAVGLSSRLLLGDGSALTLTELRQPAFDFSAIELLVLSACGTATAWSNLFLAGDWTATDLPATIEGAIRSGHRAADLVNRQS